MSVSPSTRNSFRLDSPPKIGWFSRTRPLCSGVASLVECVRGAEAAHAAADDDEIEDLTGVDDVAGDPIVKSLADLVSDAQDLGCVAVGARVISDPPVTVPVAAYRHDLCRSRRTQERGSDAQDRRAEEVPPGNCFISHCRSRSPRRGRTVVLAGARW